MTVNDLITPLQATLYTKPPTAERLVLGCYVGDLLSNVMGKAGANDAWITIMTNINIVAVALLCEISCIVLAEGSKPDPGVVEKADEEGIAILSSPRSAYELAAGLYTLFA